MKTCAYLDVKVLFRRYKVLTQSLYLIPILGLHMAWPSANARIAFQNQTRLDAIFTARLHDVQVGGYSLFYALRSRSSLVGHVSGG